jgi:hypothetical protein
MDYSFHAAPTSPKLGFGPRRAAAYLPGRGARKQAAHGYIEASAQTKVKQMHASMLGRHS